MTCTTLPRLYGVPNMHKKKIPLRPIVSAINSPKYNLEEYIAHILKQKNRKNSHLT